MSTPSQNGPGNRPQGAAPQWSSDGRWWWDGHRWIPAPQARAAAGGAHHGQQSYPVSPPGARPKTPWYTSWWFITSCTLAVGLCGLGIVGAALSTDDSTSDTAAGSTSEARSSEPAGDSSPTTEPSETAEEPERAPEPEKEEKKQERKPPSKSIKVRADQIVQEFQDNELAGDMRYKGKTLEVTGVVDEVDTELFDDEKYILRIGGGDTFELWTVDCYGMSTKELSSVDKGDTVTVIGEFDDGGDLGVELSGCRLA